MKKDLQLASVAVAITVAAIPLLFGGRSQVARISPTEGKIIFKAHCSICHGVDGSGDTASGKKMKARDLRSARVQKQSDDHLLEAIMYGMGKMPAFEKKLGREESQQVIAYIRELAQQR